MERLILFDIDGTLTRTQNGYLPFNEAILKTFGFAGDIRTVVPDGNTDPLIVQDIFTKVGVEIAVGPAQWQQFTAQLASSYREHIARGATTIRPLPGADSLLRQLSAAQEFHSQRCDWQFRSDGTSETGKRRVGALSRSRRLCQRFRAPAGLAGDRQSALGGCRRAQYRGGAMHHRRRHAQRFAVRARQRHEMRACRHRPLFGRRAGVLAARWLSGGSERAAASCWAACQIVKIVWR